MEIIAIVLGFVCILVLFQRTAKLRSDLDLAHKQIRLLAQELGRSKKAEPVIEPVPKPVTIALTPHPQTNMSKTRFFESEKWKRGERFVLENLTGILGTLGVVLGLGFLGVYTALMLEPMFRVGLLMVISAAIAGGAGYFLHQGKWKGLAQWLQSAAFAVLLLACLGSGGIPGLKWINNPIIAWVVLSLGIIANLGLAYVRKQLVFASVHGVLSLAALAVAGASPLVVTTMSIVAVASLLLIGGKKWQLHLAIIELAFVTVLLVFYLIGPRPSDFLRIVTSAGLIMVFLVGQGSHYRKIHSNSTWDTPAVLTHLLFWALTCLGLFLYVPQHSMAISPCLLGVAIFVGLLARYARRRGILWLYKIDTLFSLASALGAILGLLAWQLALSPAMLLLLVTSLCFTLLMIYEQEKVLAKIATRLTELVSIIILGLTVTGSDAIALTVAALLIAVFQVFFVHQLKILQPPQSLYDIILPWFFVVAALIIPKGDVLYGLPSGYGLLLEITVLFLWLRARTSKLLSLGLLTATASYSALQWVRLFLSLLTGASDWLYTLMVSIPMLAIPLAGVLLLQNAAIKSRVWLVWTFGANLLISTILVLWLHEPALIPLALLVFGTALVWIPTIWPSPLASPVRSLGYTLLSVAVLAYTPLIVLSQTLASQHLLRGGFELVFALIVFLNYPMPKLQKNTRNTKLDNCPALFLELTIAIGLINILFEVPRLYHPTALAFIALILVLIALHKKSPARIVIYAYLGFLASMGLMTLASATGIGGQELVVSAIIQALGLFLLFKAHTTKSILFPQAMTWLGNIFIPLFHRLPLITVIPLAGAWALSLGFSFDATLLTLLWSLEAFGIFLLALVLKEALFRLISLSALGICLVRLVFFDLAQADTLSRALVFLGMGLLLILMNILYTRFKNRES